MESLANQRKRPLLLALFSGLGTIVCGLAVFQIALNVVLPSGGGESFAINGLKVSSDDVWQFQVFVVLPYFSASLAACVGLFNAKKWGRILILMVLFWPPIGMLAVNFELAVQLFIGSAVPLLFAEGLLYWYLFRKKNVVTFFSGEH